VCSNAVDVFDHRPTRPSNCAAEAAPSQLLGIARTRPSVSSCRPTPTVPTGLFFTRSCAAPLHGDGKSLGSCMELGVLGYPGDFSGPSGASLCSALLRETSPRAISAGCTTLCVLFFTAVPRYVTGCRRSCVPESSVENARSIKAVAVSVTTTHTHNYTPTFLWTLTNPAITTHHNLRLQLTSDIERHGLDSALLLHSLCSRIPAASLSSRDPLHVTASSDERLRGPDCNATRDRFRQCMRSECTPVSSAWLATACSSAVKCHACHVTYRIQALGAGFGAVHDRFAAGVLLSIHLASCTAQLQLPVSVLVSGGCL
jgi:hypothetical protein